jgi:hypothetical protein
MVDLAEIRTGRHACSACFALEGKTEKHGRFATSEQREKAAWGVHHEVGHRHFT